jgi:serine/threonine protein kinase/outer membrane protein assembly factor BamB
MKEEIESLNWDLVLRNELVDLLSKISSLATHAGRDVILRSLPTNVANSIPRNDDFRLDIVSIVDRLASLGPLRDGRWPLLILIDDVLAMTESTALEGELEALRRKIESQYAQLNQASGSTQLSEPSAIWTTELARSPRGSAKFFGNMLLVPTQKAEPSDKQNSVLCGLSLIDGSIHWQRTFDHEFVSGLAVTSHGLILVATASTDLLRGEGALRALDGLSGKTRWRWSPGVQRISAPAIAEDIACVTIDAKMLVTLDITSGEERARADLTSTASLSAPALKDDAAYIPCRGPHLLAVGLDGDTRWHFTTDDGPNGWLDKTPIVVGDYVFAGLSTGAVLALRVVEGEVTWRSDVGLEGKPLSPLVTDGARLFVGARDGLHTIILTDGSELWHFPTSRRIEAAPVLRNGVVYATCHDHHLYALNAVSGEELWRHEVDHRIEASPVLARWGELPEEGVIIADRGGTITAVSRPLSAAEHEARGHWLKAARLREARGQRERAAELYEKAGAWQEAAKLWGALGRPLKQAEALEQYARSLGESGYSDEEQATAWRSAARVFKAQGERERVVDCQKRVAQCLHLPIVVSDIELDKGLVLDTWSRLRFIVRNEGFGPARNLVIRAMGDQFQGQVMATQQIITLGAGQERAERLDICPLAYGDSVPLRVRAEYRDRTGETRVCEHTVYLPIARDEGTRSEGQTIHVFLALPDVTERDDKDTESIRIGRYETIEEVGRGGFALVYKARDTVLDRIVALKVLHAHVAENPMFALRFLQEGRTAAQFSHPNIVTIYEVGEETGQQYIAMNYLPGRGLDERLAEAEGPLPLEQVVSIVNQVADGLDYIHQRGVVHRDVKPSNVMLSDEDHATLLDFGIVRAAEGTQLTTVGEKMGTPQYMSPEQAEGKEIDHRSDLYALGVMAYQMCTGQTPFDDVSPLVVLRLHPDKAPPSPQELNPDLPPQVGQVLLKVLSKRPDERYQSAGAFAKALREALAAIEQARKAKTIAGRYQILSELGRGGFAVIYKARDTKLDRIVALKVIRKAPTVDAAFSQRFEQEMRIAAALFHPNIVSTYDFGETKDELYLAMECIGDGYTLRYLLAEQGSLSPEQALPILTQLANALDFLHQRSPPLIHRDIKPANVLLEREKNGFNVSLTDFGLVRSMQSSQEITRSGSILGTPAYLAPEQADAVRWGEVTPLTDVYALGVLAYEMLTGRTPFEGETLAVLHAHAYEEPPSPQGINPGLDSNLSAVLLRALSKSPKDRPGSAGAFVAELQALVDGQVESRWVSRELVPWFLSLSCGSRVVEVGQSVRVVARLSQRSLAEREVVVRSADDRVSIQFMTDGLSLQSERLQTFVLSEQAEELHHEIELIALRPGNFRVAAKVQEGARDKSTDTEISVRQSESQTLPELPSPMRPRPGRHPDLITRVYATPLDEAGQAYRLRYVAFSPISHLRLPGVPIGSIDISAAALAQFREELSQLVSRMSNIPPTICRARLAALGKRLYQIVFPQEMRDLYDELTEANIESWLILSEKAPWVPWELIRPFDSSREEDFLGARFAITRFIEGLGTPRQYEFPLGRVSLTLDDQLRQQLQPQEWEDLFPPGAVPWLRSSLMQEYAGGYISAMEYNSPIWGMHFAGVPGSLARRGGALVTRDSRQAISEETVRDAMLDFWSKRPLVTFGMVGVEGRSALTEMERQWVPTFVKAGVASFVGTLWATKPQADRLFWSTFYRAIWSRKPLGEAALIARRAVRSALPNSMDWLAYFTVGDPMARGYRPKLGEGYASLNFLSHDLKQPMRVGETYSFYASLGQPPPTEYHGRRYRTEDFAIIQEPYVMIFAPEFEVGPGKRMPLVQRGDRLGQSFHLRPHRAGRHDLFVKFFDGEELLQTIDFTVEVKGS